MANLEKLEEMIRKLKELDHEECRLYKIEIYANNTCRLIKTEKYNPLHGPETHYEEQEILYEEELDK